LLVIFIPVTRRVKGYTTLREKTKHIGLLSSPNGHKTSTGTKWACFFISRTFCS